MAHQRKTSFVGYGEFHTTHWSIVLAAGKPSHPEAMAALGKLCHQYWFPLYAYIRRRGYGAEEARDLTQEFFSRLLQKSVLQFANPDRGRFRSFLLTSCSNFLNNEWDRNHALKRGAGCIMISIDATAAENHYMMEPHCDETPEHAFDRHWAHEVLEQALAAIKQEYTRAGKETLYVSLQGTLPGGSSEISYEEVGRKLNLSEAAVKMAAHRLRRRFATQLRQSILQTLGSRENLEEELRYLVSVL